MSQNLDHDLIFRIFNGILDDLNHLGHKNIVDLANFLVQNDPSSAHLLSESIIHSFIGENMKEISKKDVTFTTTLKDTDDGSGDFILEIPDEITEQMQWKEGTLLNIDVQQDGTILLTEVQKNNSTLEQK
ncbi:MAG: hypothetical protein EBU90_24785 [Proteobacteria bacterium]|nr:hypothetical protein [Pseudomonadota bacterium]NBP16739.1 hypothetical protein [bacterium]